MTKDILASVLKLNAPSELDPNSPVGLYEACTAICRGCLFSKFPLNRRSPCARGITLAHIKELAKKARTDKTTVCLQRVLQ